VTRPQAPQRILLIIDKCQPGDALRVQPGVDAVRQQYPKARLVILTSEAAREIFAGSSGHDRLVTSRLYRQQGASRFRSRIGKAAELIRLVLVLGRGYDLVIIFWWGTTLLRVLARLVGSGRRIGYEARPSGLLTSRIGAFDFDADDAREHERLLQVAGIEPRHSPTLQLTDSAGDRQRVAMMLQAEGVGASQPLVVFHPGSDWACQQWLPERWAALTDRLIASYEVVVVFTGVAAERDAVEAIRGRVRSTATISLAGRTTLSELRALLRRSRLCVCVDSATFLVVKTTGTPTVVLAGPSSPERAPGPVATVINRTTAADRLEIARNKQSKFSRGNCHDWTCAMAGLRGIGVSDVLGAIERQGDLGLQRRVAMAGSV
jgi:ADP-heptose:LPS heptosyltransferase